jgi:hypothetical protein
MYIKRLASLVLGIILTVSAAIAGGTASPFSRYGYGEFQNSVSGALLSMGGVGYGMRTNRVINPSNPASYTSIDSLTFMMDLGLSGVIDGAKTNLGRNTQFAGNIDYVSFQMPLAEWAAVSFGVNPLTIVGYEYKFTDVQPSYGYEDSITVSQYFYGKGGITQVYLGLSFDICDRVAIGVNGRYLFGNIFHYREVTFPGESLFKPTIYQNAIYVNAWQCDFGFQYHQPIGEDDQLVIGGTYSMKLPMKNTTEIHSVTNKDDSDNTSYEFEYPQTAGAGVSYLWNNRLLIGADVTWMQLSQVKYYSQDNVFTDRFVYALGCEYVHNPISKSYAETMRFRLGANYSNSYAKVNGSDYNKWAITCGIGFPLPNTKTTLNLHLEYGQQGSMKNIGLVEQYGKIGIGVSLNERWFVKRRFN